MVCCVAQEECHSLFRPGHQQCGQVERLAQRLCLVREFLLVTPAPDDLPKLGAVGRQQRRAAIGREVLALGIDQHRFVRLFRELDHARDASEAALAVIGQDHDVDRLHQRLVLGHLRLQQRVGRRHLEIATEQLLLTADHAQLDDRRERRVGLENGADTGRRKQPRKAAAGLVVADNRKQRRAGAKTRRIARNVRGATGTLFGPRHVDDRHRRFRRDPLDVAEPVAIEHHVADDEDARLGDALAIGFESHWIRECAVSRLRGQSESTRILESVRTPAHRDSVHRKSTAPQVWRARLRNRDCGILSTR